MKLESKTAVLLCEAAGFDPRLPDEREDCRKLVTEVRTVLGAHREMAEELAKEPRASEQHDNIRQVQQLVSRLRALLMSLDVETREAIERPYLVESVVIDPGTLQTSVLTQRLGEGASVYEVNELLRHFEDRLLIAGGRLEQKSSMGAPKKTARDLTLTALRDVYVGLALMKEDSEGLVDFIRLACGAARDTQDKPAPIALPKRKEDVLALLPELVAISPAD